LKNLINMQIYSQIDGGKNIIMHLKIMIDNIRSYFHDIDSFKLTTNFTILSHDFKPNNKSITYKYKLQYAGPSFIWRFP
jgi:hypothetical protein